MTTTTMTTAMAPNISLGKSIKALFANRERRQRQEHKDKLKKECLQPARNTQRKKSTIRMERCVHVRARERDRQICARARAYRRGPDDQGVLVDSEGGSSANAS
jgi:hypothetical protein